MAVYNGMSLHCTSDGVIWAGGDGGEGFISRYDGRRFISYTTIEGALAIESEPDGVMWFGNYNGLYRYDGEILGIDTSRKNASVVRLSIEDGLGHTGVWVGYRAPDGAIWLGTGAGGVSKYDGQKFVHFTEADSVPTVYSPATFSSDADGGMWVGMGLGGLFRYDGNRFQQVRLGGAYHAICHADTRLTWFGTRTGADHYDGKEFVRFTEADGLAGNWVRAIDQASDGTIWFGTTGGLSRLDTGAGQETEPPHFVNITTSDGLVHNNVRVIHSDQDGLWFGTAGGISRYDGQTFTNFTIEDGLANNYVLPICPDRDGTMWFGTYGGGACHYDGIAWSSLDARDGLGSGTVRSVHKDDDGFMWFGVEGGGLTRYRPRSTTPPTARIISVQSDKVYTDLSAIGVIPTGGRITIKYGAIDLKTIPDKRQYRIRIDELDADWQKPTKADTLDVSFDKPGTYTFSVQAIDRDLVYSDPVSLTLKIKRPWWQYILGGMILAGAPLAYGFYQIGKRRQTQRAIAQRFNPYIAGRVVGEDLFYGRNDLITDIERTLHNNCFLLYGERRISKTSLQHQLRERLSNADDPTYKIIPAYIDMQGVAEDDFFHTIATGVVEACRPFFREELALRLDEERESYTYRDLNRDLRAILNHLQEGETRAIKLVLLMDEVDTLNTYSLRTNLNLRGLFMGPLKENLVIVMSGVFLKMDWSEEGGGSPPFNFLSREIQIQPLEEAPARQLITEPAKGFYTYEPKAVDLILSYSELKPFTIQGICLRAVNRVLADGRTKITADDIEAIKDSTLSELQSIRGERAGTALPTSLNEALALLNEEKSRVEELEAEIKRLGGEAA